MRVPGRVCLFVAVLLALPQIASAVELTLPDKVPAHYAREVEQGGRKVIVFGTGSTSYEPKVLDQVLEGYTYEQCGEQFSSWGEAYPVPPQFV